MGIKLTIEFSDGWQERFTKSLVRLSENRKENYKVFAENLKHEINLTYVKAVRLNAWKEDDLERIASEFDRNTQDDLINKINLIVVVLQNIRKGILDAKR